jgi:acyl-coenzyme A synthetase/AMP-(fatty) acid ligase
MHWRNSSQHRERCDHTPARCVTGGGAGRHAKPLTHSRRARSTMARIPLLANFTAHDVLCYRRGQAISARQFIADAAALAALLPAGTHVLNVCTDRYRFAVGFAACLIAGKISLLPPSQVPEVIRQLRAFAPDACYLTDEADTDIDLPGLHYPESSARPDLHWQVPVFDAARRVAYFFTSGSTGTSVPHAKTWGALTAAVAVEAQRISMLTGRPGTVVATVPPQHLFGFESSLLLGLQSGQALCAERPFYPADIAMTLASVPSPRMLVSTPVHLRALVAAGIALPALDLVLCSTAPLESALAVHVEQRLAAPLLEIYGSTETGQIACRRTATSAEWQLWPEVSLSVRDGHTWAAGGHVGAAVPLGDVVEILPENRFLLLGRTLDLVNIAGKRSSLSYLNHQLTAIPGVVDAFFYWPQDAANCSATGVRRLAALAVAPGLTAEEIVHALRMRVDPVFLPRPLRLVEHIPRTASGKLPLATLQSLTQQTARGARASGAT